MAENLTSRVGRIVSGSLNALVSALEDASPETVLEQAVREVEAAVDDVRAELGRELAKKHLASTRLMELNRRHEDLAEKITLALREGREDLAEAAASQQIDFEAQIPVVERHLADCGDREHELEGLIAALQAKKREMGEELKQYRESHRDARASATTAGDGVPASSPASGVTSRVDRATSAFDRVLERSTGVSGSQRTDLGTEKQLAELEELAHRNRVHERVAAARAKLGPR